MRVTKIIREYVEKTVNNALPYGAPKNEYIAANQKMNELCERPKNDLRGDCPSEEPFLV